MTPQSSFLEHDGAATTGGGVQDTGASSAADVAITARFTAAFTAKRVVWRTGQLCEAGFGPRAIRRLRNSLLIHHFATPTTSRAGFVYSHVSAARLHGLYLWQADEFIHLTQAGKPSSIGFGKDTRVRVTTLERTVIDCCLTMHYRQALILTDHALRLGASLSRLLAEAETLRTHRGIRTLRKARPQRQRPLGISRRDTGTGPDARTPH